METSSKPSPFTTRNQRKGICIIAEYTAPKKRKIKKLHFIGDTYKDARIKADTYLEANQGKFHKQWMVACDLWDSAYHDDVVTMYSIAYNSPAMSI